MSARPQCGDASSLVPFTLDQSYRKIDPVATLPCQRGLNIFIPPQNDGNALSFMLKTVLFTLSLLVTFRIVAQSQVSVFPTATLCNGDSVRLCLDSYPLPIVSLIWQDSTSPGWNDLPNTAPFQGVDNDTLLVFPSTAALNGRRYRCLIDTGGTIGYDDTTESVSLLTFPQLSAGVISEDDTICAGATPNLLQPSVAPSGGSGNYTYQWYYSIDSLVWQQGSSTSTFQPGTLAVTTWFFLTVSCDSGCGVDTTNVVRILVVPTTSIANAGADQFICGTSTSLAGNLPLVGSGTWTIVSGMGGLVTNPVSPNSNFIGMAGESYTLRWTVSNPPCIPNIDDVNVSFITFSTAPSAISGTTTICVGSSTTLEQTGGVLGFLGSYQWSSGSCGGTPTGTGPIITVSPSVTTTYFVRAEGLCNTSPCANVTVNVAPLPVTAQILGPGIVCANSIYKRYELSPVSPTTQSFQWSCTGGSIMGSSTDPVVWIHWGSGHATGQLEAAITDTATRCAINPQRNISIRLDAAPDTTSIIRIGPSNLLVCNDSSAGIAYQWGYITRSTMVATDIPGANLRYVQLPHTYDSLTYIYYVRTSYGDCSTMSYMNYDPVTPIVEAVEALPEVVLYPNPARDRICVRGLDMTRTQVAIMNLQGQTIPGQVDLSEQCILLGDQLPAGVYFVVLSHRGGSLTRKFIIAQ